MGKLRSRKEKRPTRVEGTWENRTVVPSALYRKNGEVTARGLLTRRTRGSFLSPGSALAEGLVSKPMLGVSQSLESLFADRWGQRELGQSMWFFSICPVPGFGTES